MSKDILSSSLVVLALIGALLLALYLTDNNEIQAVKNDSGNLVSFK